MNAIFIVAHPQTDSSRPSILSSAILEELKDDVQ